MKRASAKTVLISTVLISIAASFQEPVIGDR